MGAKSRGNFQVTWCKNSSCVFHSTTECDGCYRYSKLLVKLCEHCKEAYLEFIGEDEPYSVAHLACPNCDSTYVLEENE